MRLGKLTFLLTAGIGLGLSSFAMAQQQQQNPGVVGVRQNAMRAQAGHMGAMQKILTEYPQLLSHVSVHATAIAEGAEYTPEMFPEGSNKDGTKATDAVWTDQDGFKKAAARAEELAKKLAETAKGGDAKATLAAFGDLGKQGCGGCHETFRQKQN